MAYKRVSAQPVAEGGTGAITLTNHGVLLGQGTSAIVATAVGTNGQVLTGVTGSDPVWASPAASSISITGDSGGALTGAAFIFTGGTTGLTFSGAGSTETLTGTLVVANGGTGATTLTGVLIGNGTSAVTANAVTQYNVLVGGASNAISSVAPHATSGVPLISQGSSANPAFGTAVVAGGGTGLTSATAYAVLCGGTTSTGNFQSIAGVGTSGQVLTSNGAGALPTFQTASGGVSIARIVLTNSQIKAIHATPITIVSAPGSGLMLVVQRLVGQLNYGGNNAFTNGGGATLQLFYTDSTGTVAGTILNTAGITGTTTQIVAQTLPNINNVLTSNLDNKALVASQTSVTEIAGNAANDNTITVYVYYTTLTL